VDNEASDCCLSLERLFGLGCGYAWLLLQVGTAMCRETHSGFFPLHALVSWRGQPKVYLPPKRALPPVEDPRTRL